jgi:hypothetical protein
LDVIRPTCAQYIFLSTEISHFSEDFFVEEGLTAIARSHSSSN